LFENYAELFRNTTAEGVADRTINANPEQRRESTSGEARLTWRGETGPVTSVVHLMARGRYGTSRYGGSSSVALGKATVGVLNVVKQPTFSFGPQSNDDVKQLTGGIGYDGTWKGVAQLSFGVQKSTYEKTVEAPGSSSSIRTHPWLYNIAGALYLKPRFAIYGGYTRGMEENGTAPDAAANRGEPLPSAVTSQRELGFRYALTRSVQLVGGVFDLRKPYFSLDSRNVFMELGSLSTRGLEFSLAGVVLPGLNVVAGAVLMDPRVTGEAVELGRVGDRAVAQTRHLARINADYRLPSWPSLSIDAGIVYSGPVTAGIRPDPLTGRQFEVPARTVLDLGARYRFRIADAPAVIRLQIMNVTNAGGWEPTSSGGLQREDPRRAQLQLSADF
jgi:iron complex outermembrane receptor protein